VWWAWRAMPGTGYQAPIDPIPIVMMTGVKTSHPAQ
jgi:hypothetical protein